ncbi:MAG: class I SAM-dependent methyltransferase [Fimbriimonadaceae bacterium]
MKNPISRFTGKAQAYASGRPIYPQKTLTELIESSGLSRSANVYDLGAGTGLFTELLLYHFHHVTLIEPNYEMASTASERLPKNRITIQNQHAESFVAAPNSIDIITAAQAFHWFDRTKANVHWKSMLKPSGFVALIWNERTTESPFAKEISNLLNEMTKRDPKNPPPQEGSDQEILNFFSQAELKTTTHSTPLTKQELINLVLSRSYAPNKADADYNSIVEKVQSIFQSHQVNQSVNLPYQTKLLIGQI